MLHLNNRYFKQTELSDNGAAAVRNLISLLNIAVSVNAIKTIKLHPDYPNLLSISYFLSNWNVENLSVKIASLQIKEIPFPAIAHLHKNNGHFVVLQKFEDELLQYIDSEVGVIKESLHEFEKKWTGVVLLVQANEKSGEENYRLKRNKEIFQNASLITVYTLLTLLLLLPIQFISWPHASIYVLKIIGGLLCYFLLQKQFGGSNAKIDAFCKMGSKSDCDSVINSPASKVFGVVHLSEIGTWYFFGGIISVVIGAFVSDSVESIFFILSALAFPFNLFAIYYQGWVIKKWCPLCLAVMAVLWLEFIAHLIMSDNLAITWDSLLITFVGFSLPLIFWLSVRQQFLDSFKLPNMERNLNRFLKSERVFQKLLEDQPEIEIGNFSNELQAGAGEAPIIVTVVSNPVCGPCTYAHAVIEDLLERFEGKLRVVFRFAINPSDIKSESYEMLSHLMALRLGSSNEKSIKALSHWYLENGKHNFRKWKEENPISKTQNQDSIDLAIMEHARWSTMAHINATPTVLINGKKLPEEFSVADLKYQLRKLIEKINEPEPIS
ncbi:MAG: cysteine peptidase family C39 domain-containing protein [Cyclobacteriaceae bacterium]